MARGPNIPSVTSAKSARCLVDTEWQYQIALGVVTERPGIAGQPWPGLGSTTQPYPRPMVSKFLPDQLFRAEIPLHPHITGLRKVGGDCHGQEGRNPLSGLQQYAH
jgi:hypothetical protein